MLGQSHKQLSLVSFLPLVLKYNHLKAADITVDIVLEFASAAGIDVEHERALALVELARGSTAPAVEYFNGLLTDGTLMRLFNPGGMECAVRCSHCEQPQQLDLATVEREEELHVTRCSHCGQPFAIVVQSLFN